MDFGGPDPPKLSSCLSKTLILIKSPFSPQVGFLMKSQAHKVPKGHQGPGQEVPAGVDRSSTGVRGSVDPGVSGGGSLGILRTDRFWDAFWDAFWMDFGSPDRPKLSSRLSETLILIKSPFSSRGGFLMQNGGQKAPKMEPKRY